MVYIVFGSLASVQGVFTFCFVSELGTSQGMLFAILYTLTFRVRTENPTVSLGF